jgi:5-methylcytosine-specific restriction endonuclease McrA
MSAQAQYSVRKREAIFEIFGKKCAACGDTKNLEFDVIVPTKDAKSHHSSMSWSGRMAFYCRQLVAGNLQVLCSRCNSSKSRGASRYVEPLAFKRRKPSEDPY